MNFLRFYVSWNGEPSAGIRSGYEEVTIQFKYAQPIDEDVIEYWRETLKDFYDGSYVLTEEEYEKTI